MHVLDIGCGIGDVSFLGARLVGSSGSVVGIDRGDQSIETAGRRAQSLGIRNVAFVAADISSFKTEKMFDAIIGRLVLLYLPDPAKSLQRLSSLLRPGGVIAFQEMDMSTFPLSSLALRNSRPDLDTRRVYCGGRPDGDGAHAAGDIHDALVFLAPK